MRPYVILKAALSLDGYLDDASAERCVFSGPEDKAQVDALRASCDAILVGAQTLRADNARLRVLSEDLRAKREAEGKPEHPQRVCVTRSGNLSQDLHFFNASSGALPLLFCAPCVVSDLRQQFEGVAEVISLPEDSAVMPAFLLEKLCEYGVQRLLVEGGAEILQEFLKAGVVDEIRLAYAALSLGDNGSVRLELPQDSFSSFTLSQVEQVGQMSVLRLESQSIS